MRATLTINPRLPISVSEGFLLTMGVFVMSEFEKETLSDLSKILRLQADRPLPSDSIWRQMENSVTWAVIMFLATWWIATIIS